MKKIIAFLCFLFCAVNVFAQEFSLEKAVYLNNDETIEVAPGTPIIFTNKESPQNIFNPEQASWRPETPLIEIKSFGGERLQVPFITHIPLFMAFVQVLPDKTAVVTERIVLVNTSPLPYFLRRYPFSLKDKEGKDISYKINFLSASVNGKNEYPEVKETTNSQDLIFFSDIGLSSGVHQIEISYELPNAVLVEGDVARLFLHFVGQENLYPLERGKMCGNRL